MEKVNEDDASYIPTLKTEPFSSIPQITFTTTSSSSSTVLRTLVVENTTDSTTTITINKLPISDTFTILPIDNAVNNNTIVLESGKKQAINIQWQPKTTATSTVHDNILFQVKNKYGNHILATKLHANMANVSSVMLSIIYEKLVEIYNSKYDSWY